MMLFSKLCVTMTLLGIVDGECVKTSWVQNINYEGQLKCKEYDFYINGLERNSTENFDGLHLLTGVHCCSPPLRYLDSDTIVIYENWAWKFEQNNRWAYCPQGFFLHGLQTTSSDSGINYLQNIKYARCIKPSNHPESYADCYYQNLNFNKQGVFNCRDDYYVTGLHKGNCDSLRCLDKLHCCKMEVEQRILDNVDKVKTKIMESTLPKLVRLAAALGYGHAAGNKGIYIGDDFKREGDSWVADSRLFWGEEECTDLKCKEILAVEYLEWSLTVKEIKYGEKYIDYLEPEVVHSVVFHNENNTSSIKTFQYSNVVSETVTHSPTSRWRNNEKLSVSLEFGTNLFSKVQMPFKTGFQYSELIITGNNEAERTTLHDTLQHNIPPNTSAQYKVLLKKIRTTIPYTAVIIANFSVRYRGFLGRGNGFDSEKTNFHINYRESTDRPGVPYTFGNKSEAFYTALSRQIASKEEPWMWEEILRKDPSLGEHIKKLTEENKYKFTLNGKLEHVAGAKFDSMLTLMKLNSFSGLEENQTETQYLNDILIAKEGPKDKPVDRKIPEYVLKYPKVDLDDANPLKLEPILKDLDYSS
ncbi:Biomphalysin 21 [Biomphalaria glabrata]|nr:Biomphalysin 21 uncharacterized protein LO NA Biomphalysin 21 [Biomphalaria glabrata]